MSMYRTPIVVGDRVALAPHTDLWMAGVRYGTVERIYLLHKVMSPSAPVYTVRLDTNRVVSLVADDLLGAVAGTRVGGDSQ